MKTALSKIDAIILVNQNVLYIFHWVIFLDPCLAIKIKHLNLTICSIDINNELYYNLGLYLVVFFHSATCVKK